MYCERCNRIIETDRCPFCKNSKVREPEAKDPCFLTEQPYLSSGILEDLLKQNNIPYLKKDVMGAGMAIRVGPMFEMSRFYVSYDQLGGAQEVIGNLFPPAEADPPGNGIALLFVCGGWLILFALSRGVTAAALIVKHHSRKVNQRG